MIAHQKLISKIACDRRKRYQELVIGEEGHPELESTAKYICAILSEPQEKENLRNEDSSNI